MIWMQAVVVAVFVLAHLFAGGLHFLDRVPRSRWLSLAGGISVAYVFVHLLPELGEAQETIAETGVLGYVEHHAHLVALVGLAAFYGLERLVQSAQGEGGEGELGEGAETTAGQGVFWLHIASFALYNGLIGYLLVHREEQDVRGLLLFSGAMGVHFLTNDYGLRKDHRRTYDRFGRWVLAASVAVGWGVGLSTRIGEAAVAVLFAFLAGGVILNVLKEELPEERKSRFLPFAAGAAGYAALLLLL